MKNILLTLVTVLMVSVSLGYAQPVFEHRSLEEALNPDGTLKQGVQGSFSVKGYTMRTGANGEPIFLPHLQNTARHLGYAVWLACAGRCWNCECPCV